MANGDGAASTNDAEMKTEVISPEILEQMEELKKVVESQKLEIRFYKDLNK